MRATIDLREQITQIEPQPVITRDNVTMKVDAVIYFVVADPVRATYEVQNLTWGIEQLTLSGLRNVIGALDLDHTLTSRDTINTQLRSALDQATQQWGVKIMRVELKNIDPPQDIKLTMEKQMTAERRAARWSPTRRARSRRRSSRPRGRNSPQIVSAEGEKQSRILEAEGQAQARLRVAEAEAQAIKVVAEAIGAAGNPAQYLIAQRYLEAFAQLGANADRIVYLPWEASGVLASLGGIRDMLRTAPVAPRRTARRRGSAARADGARALAPRARRASYGRLPTASIASIAESAFSISSRSLPACGEKRTKPSRGETMTPRASRAFAQARASPRGRHGGEDSRSASGSGVAIRQPRAARPSRERRRRARRTRSRMPLGADLLEQVDRGGEAEDVVGRQRSRLVAPRARVRLARDSSR